MAYDKSIGQYINLDKGIPIESNIDFGFWPNYNTNSGELYNFYSLSDFTFSQDLPDSCLISTPFEKLKSRRKVTNPYIIILQKDS